MTTTSELAGGHRDDETLTWTLTWTRVGDMAASRHFHNLVTLATGDVVAIGGIECDNGHSSEESPQTEVDFEAFAVRLAECLVIV